MPEKLLTYNEAVLIAPSLQRLDRDSFFQKFENWLFYRQPFEVNWTMVRCKKTN